jgi:adenine C2-methylase RlmN of 23S rRNA A2503 and tRNA A37
VSKLQPEDSVKAKMKEPLSEKKERRIFSFEYCLDNEFYSITNASESYYRTVQTRFTLNSTCFNTTDGSLYRCSDNCSIDFCNYEKQMKTMFSSYLKYSHPSIAKLDFDLFSEKSKAEVNSFLESIPETIENLSESLE